ncbi:isochorismate synthase [Bosea sp. 117]|uniref:isochorismate synthase n=1 Tax=Bosea sp. 117 TaxID=1125973 RepID=UPI0006904AD0|nr:isochorismate synthase [Bosea sp. 117]
MSSQASRIVVRPSPEAGKEGAAAPSFAPALPFTLVSGEESLAARGCRRVLTAGGMKENADDLPARVAAFFAGLSDGPRRLVGALPFERGRPAHLYQPETLGPATMPLRAAAPTPRWRVIAEPDVAAYRAAVSRALERMAAPASSAGALRKIVLSRSLRAEADAAIDAAALVAALARDASVTTFCVPLPPRRGAAERALIGATPELLVEKSGAQVASHPLAGSARRSADPAADRASAEALLHSDKDRREHAEVVEAVLDHLAPYCHALVAPEGPILVATNSMWHLGTRIEGTLKDPEVSSIELVTRLHPTPAVCGTPREAAYRAIAKLETRERDFYAGAVGWCDDAGDGRWHVAIRCAEVSGSTARLYAGAGIVPGSDPAAEAEETGAKFAALLRALGIEEAAVEAAAGETP